MQFYLCCPNCGADDYHRSHTRNLLEKLKKLVTRQKPYRCYVCDYRGWVSFQIVNSPMISKSHTVLYLGILVLSVILGILVGSTMN